jgi:hypothetical protein
MVIPSEKQMNDLVSYSNNNIITKNVKKHVFKKNGKKHTLTASHDEDMNTDRQCDAQCLDTYPIQNLSAVSLEPGSFTGNRQYAPRYNSLIAPNLSILQTKNISNMAISGLFAATDLKQCRLTVGSRDFAKTDNYKPSYTFVFQGLVL